MAHGCLVDRNIPSSIIATTGFPSFTWLYNADDVSMNISFPDGGPDDVTVLYPSIPIESLGANDDNSLGQNNEGKKQEECIYHGHLRDESNVAVSLNGCPGSDTFEVPYNLYKDINLFT